MRAYTVNKNNTTETNGTNTKSHPKPTVGFRDKRQKTAVLQNAPGLEASSVKSQAVQRVIAFGGADHAMYLPHLIDNYSARNPYFKFAVKSPNISLTINLKQGVVKGEEGINGRTHVFMHCGANTYFMGTGARPEKLLKAAMDSGDYKNLTAMEVLVDVYENPAENVNKSFEAMMTTFAHEWELHVQPSLQMYVLIKSQLEAKTEEEQEDISNELTEHTDLIMGGEAAEHANKTSRYSLIRTLLQSMEAIHEGPDGERLRHGFLEQVHNLRITPDELEEYEPLFKKDGLSAESWIIALRRG